MDNQLNREIDIPKKRIPWLKYFFQIAIPAFLASCDHRTQGKVKAVGEFAVPKKAESTAVDQTCTTTVGYIMPEIIGKDSIIEETYTTTVGVIAPQIIEKDSVIAPSGQKHLQQKSIILPEVILPGVPEQSPPPLNNATINAIPGHRSVGDGIRVTLGGINVQKCYSLKISKPVQLVKRFFKDTAFNKFRIYPNPVRSNSALTIEWKQKDYGDHLLQLFNQSGQLVLSREINIGEGSKLFMMPMPSIMSGTYFLKLTSKPTGKSYTEKLIVE
jgi:hypothetical protein